ncbi:MAG: zinc ribbon domain-containing protein [Candidatus Izemoplasmataceae bacterium]
MTNRTCPACGAKVETHFNVCPHCGHTLKTKTPSYDKDFEDKKVLEESQVLWGLIGFIVPVAGLVLYLVWQSDRPLAAKAAGMGALVSVIISAVAGMFVFTMMFGMFGRVWGMM